MRPVSDSAARSLAFPFLVIPLLSAPTAAQSLDVFPSYASDGPDAGYFEVYQGSPLRVDVAYQGLTHEQSVAQYTSGIPFLVTSASSLPFPIPIQPGADLWLDLLSVKTLPIGPELEINAEWTHPTGLDDVVIPCQVAVLELLPTTILVDLSDLYQINFIQPPAPIDDEMRPVGALASGSQNVFFDAGGNGYRFQFDDGVDPVDYALDLDNPDNQRGALLIHELNSGIFPVRNGGFWYARGDGVLLYPPSQFKNLGNHVLENHFQFGNTVTLVYRDEIPNLDNTATVINRRQFEITLRGRSLEIHGKSLETEWKSGDTYFAFSLENIQWPEGQIPDWVRVPFMDQIGILLINQDRYVSRFIDMFHSGAQFHTSPNLSVTGQTALFAEAMFYRPSTEGLLRPVDERGFATVSRELEQHFVETSAGKSPNYDAASELVTVALTNLPTANAYARDLGNTLRMQDWGFDKVLAFKFHWMHFGLNRRATTHAPADPGGGTEAQFVNWANAATSGGWRIALYSDFYSLDQAPQFDDNPNYSEGPLQYINYEDAVIGQDGQYLNGFQTLIDDSGPGGPDYFTRLISPKRALRHFERESAILKANYGTNAHAFDVVSIAAPDQIITGDFLSGQGTQGNISYDAESANDSSIAEAIVSYKNLFRNASLTMGGPVVGEGGFSNYGKRFDSFYAGYIDGLWRTLTSKGAPNIPGEGNQSELVMPDYEVRYVRPKMAGLYGLGVYERFFEQDPTQQLPIKDFAMNEWRATEIAYMHNGYLMTTSKEENAGDFLTWAQQIKEYYTMVSLAAEWNVAGQGTVSYRQPWVGAPWLSLSDMFKVGGYDFAKPMLRITYPSGLVMYVNHTEQTVFEGPWQIPTHGWAVENPNSGYKNLSVLDPATGQRYDLVEAPNYVYGDGNGTTRDFGGALGVLTDLKVVRFDKGFTLTEDGTGNITKL